MPKLTCSEFKSGRRFVGRLPRGKDLIKSIEAFCGETAVSMATFSAIGAVTSVTLGAYDQKQQVYVTWSQDAPFEIASCTGNVSLKDGNLMVHAHIVLADMHGKTLGGHLFSDTILFAGEIDLLELTGEPMKRAFDPVTGLWLWGRTS